MINEKNVKNRNEHAKEKEKDKYKPNFRINHWKVKDLNTNDFSALVN